MTSRTRMNVYFSPDLLKQVEGLALRFDGDRAKVNLHVLSPDGLPAGRPVPVI